MAAFNFMSAGRCICQSSSAPRRLEGGNQLLLKRYRSGPRRFWLRSGWIQTTQPSQKIMSLIAICIGFCTLVGWRQQRVALHLKAIHVQSLPGAAILAKTFRRQYNRGAGGERIFSQTCRRQHCASTKVFAVRLNRLHVIRSAFW